MRSPLILLTAAALALGRTAGAAAETPAAFAPDHFARQIAPAFEKFCAECHTGAKPEADLVLRFKDEAE